MVRGAEKLINKAFFAKKGIDFQGKNIYNVYIK
jgi:hypothetical protein